MSASSLLRRTGVRASAVAFACAALACAPAAPLISVQGGRLLASAPDGSPLSSAAVVGLELTVLDEHDSATTIRIDAEAEPIGVLAAYEVSWLDEASGRWEPLCTPSPSGPTSALALAGRWRRGGAGAFVEDSHDFSLSCARGANGKCALLGYVPGARTPGGERLTPYFEACVRMMRADYCGDGEPHTEAGVPVELSDRAGRSTHLHDRTMAFEAVWGPRGAICVRRPRLDAHVSLSQLAARCPALADAVGERCDETVLSARPDALFSNRSAVTDPAPS